MLRCQAVHTARAEACDNMGTDDNCDGVDDNIPQLGDACTNAEAEGICQNGTYQWVGKEEVII